MRSFVIALVLISALLPSTVRAQARCGHPDPEISISVCSGIIQSGRAKGRDLAVAHTERGIAYVTLLDYDRALLDFGEAIRIDPSFARAFANRGAVYGAKQDFEKALADFSRVLTLEPRSAHAFADRAGMHRLNGQDDAAIKDYTEAIRIDPAFADAILNRAITLAGTGKCAEAIPDFTRAIELNPRDPIALVDRGLCYEKTERDDLALNDYSAHLDRGAAIAGWPRASRRAVFPGAAVRSRWRRLRAGARRQSELGDRVIWKGHGEAHDRRRPRRRTGHGNGESYARRCCGAVGRSWGPLSGSCSRSLGSRRCGPSGFFCPEASTCGCLGYAFLPRVPTARPCFRSRVRRLHRRSTQHNQPEQDAGIAGGCGRS